MTATPLLITPDTTTRPEGFPFSRLREKVPEGRMRVLVHSSEGQDSSSPPEPHPDPAVGHLLPQGGRRGISGSAL